MPALDKAIVDRLQHPIIATWQGIAHDLMAGFEDTGEELDNDAAIECCIDANRLHLNGGDEEADRLVTRLCTEHGYAAVLKFLSGNFQLV